jgi:hypothetical protein
MNNENSMSNEQLAMSNGRKSGDGIYTLLPLDDFKSLLGVDDREDKTAIFCLVTATHTIEQFCMRRLLRKKHFEYIPFSDDSYIPLKEYPVREVLAVFVAGNSEKITGNKDNFLETEFYSVIPDCGSDPFLPYAIELSSAVFRLRGIRGFKVIYRSGFSVDKVPADLASACMELAAWNLNRYRGRRIGMTGNVRGSGKDGEHFEMSMPENVRGLLAPYVRRTI